MRAAAAKRANRSMDHIEQKLRTIDAGVRFLAASNKVAAEIQDELVSALVFCRSVLGRDAIDLSEKMAIKKATKALARVGIPAAYTAGERERATKRRRPR